MDLSEIWWKVLDCIHLAKHGDQWRALVTVIMNLRVPYKAGNLLTG